MWKKLALGLALTTLVGFRAEAADSDLQQIADALDVSTTKTFQFTANGSMVFSWSKCQSGRSLAEILREEFHAGL